MYLLMYDIKKKLKQQKKAMIQQYQKFNKGDVSKMAAKEVPEPFSSHRETSSITICGAIAQ